MLTKETVLDMIKREVKLRGTQTAYAKEIDCTVQYLGDVIHGRREPGAAVLKPLGLRKIIGYAKLEKKTR